MSYTPGQSSSVVADPNTPQPDDAGAAAIGVSEKFSRGDHKHLVSTDTAVALTPGGSSSAGSGTALAKASHTHALPAFGTTSGTFAEGSDTRITAAVPNTRTVSAGTGLTGGGALSSNVSLAVSYGTGAGTSAQGNDSRIVGAVQSGDSRLTDDRTASGLRTASGIVATSTATAPSVGQVLQATSGTAASWASLPAGVLPTRQVIAGTGLTGGGDLSADRTLTVAYGTSSTTACVGNDSRLSDSRAPTGAAGGGLSGTYPNPSVVYGTSSTTACVGNDSRLSDSRVPMGAAGGQLGGSYPSPTVVGVTSAGTALSIGSIVDGGFLKRSGSSIISVADVVIGPVGAVDGNIPAYDGTTGELLEDSGIAAANIVQTSDPRMAVIQQQQKWYRSALPTITNTTLASNVAYWVFIGRNGPLATIAAKVFCWMVAAGTGTIAGEIAIATTPQPPNRANQTVTVLGVANNAAMTTSWGASATTVHVNTSPFATPFPAGAYCWLGIRTQCTTAQPSIWGLTYDLGQGQILTTATAGVLTTTTYTGAVISPISAATATAWLAPDLQLSLV